jgi:hypothetical protein
MEANATPGDVTAQHKKKKPRSPSYPGIGLQEALSRARTLYEHERQNTAPIDAILHHWGYKPKSGGGLVVVAALKKFGLLADEGSGDARRARLTPLALDILLDPREDSPQRQQAIRQAAMAPTIHREILQRYPDGLPSDATLAFFLTREREFTEAGAQDLIGELRGTLVFARMTGNGDSVSRQDEDTPPAEENDGMTPGATAELERERQNASGKPGAGRKLQQQQRSVQLPVPGASWVTVQGDFPMTEQTWDSMIALLNAMKPGLVAPDDD